MAAQKATNISIRTLSCALVIGLVNGLPKPVPSSDFDQIVPELISEDSRADAMATAECNCAGRVRVFQHGDYTGWVASFHKGNYDYNKFISAGAKNDDASAICVDPGCVAEAYEHGDFGGWKATFTASDKTTCYNHNFAAQGAKNDDMSAIKVRNAMTCPPAPAPAPPPPPPPPTRYPHTAAPAPPVYERNFEPRTECDHGYGYGGIVECLKGNRCIKINYETGPVFAKDGYTCAMLTPTPAPTTAPAPTVTTAPAPTVTKCTGASSHCSSTSQCKDTCSQIPAREWKNVPPSMMTCSGCTAQQSWYDSQHS